MKTPEGKRIVFTLHSVPHKDLRLRWKASVAFAPASTDDSVVEITLVDGEETPVAEGELEFAGCRTAIVGGKGTLRCGDFIAGKHESFIWMYRPGIAPVPGMLTFE